MIFVTVKTSLKIMAEATKMTIYTKAVVKGIIYPKSFLEMRYT